MTPPPTLQLSAPAEVFRRRRQTLAKHLTRPVVIFAGQAPARNYASNSHPFRAGSTYLYYGGPPLEGASWLIEPDSDGDSGCTLFRVPHEPEDTLWSGEAPDDGAICAAAGLSSSGLAVPDQVAARLAGREAGHVAPPCLSTAGQIHNLGLASASEQEQLAVINMRLIKDEHELARMRHAADIAVEMHQAAMAATVPGAGEVDVASRIHATLVAHHATPSFTPIATIRGEILHNQTYFNRIHQDALMLIDAGAEEPCGYASDITRTFPANGCWTDIQRHLYDTVLRAMRPAIEACTPGTRYRDIHDLAAQVVCEGLIAAELLHGDAATLVERKAHTLFFPHGVGHLIGLDVHDMEDFGDVAGYAPGRTRRPAFGDKYLRLDRDLEPGMCVTIEPGIYLVPAVWQMPELSSSFADVVNRPAVDRLLQADFGGIRIEEDVLVREASQGGPEILTAHLPSDADEVAACVGRNA